MPSSSQIQDSDKPIDILLVEDNPGDIRLAQEAFRTTESETRLHPITNGADAIDFLTQQCRDESASLPDIALIDLNLPGKDGCEVLRAIRTDPQLQCLPVIILTSSNANEDVVRCYDAYANAYLTKPTDPSEFVSLAETLELFWFEKVQLPPIPP